MDIAAATPTSPKLTRDVQDRAIEKYIQAAGSFLDEARINPDLAEGLATAGYDDEELAYGLSLHETAWNAFNALRIAAPTPGASAESDLDARIDDARDEFAAFKLVARACFVTLDARLDLRVLGDIPEDLQRFINAAHAGYTAAAEKPYADKLARRGYTVARLKTLSDSLDSLAALDAALDAAEEAVVEGPVDTEDRDQAYVKLKDYMKEIRGVARAIFRKQPEMLEKLGL